MAKPLTLAGAPVKVPAVQAKNFNVAPGNLVSAKDAAQMVGLCYSTFITMMTKGSLPLHCYRATPKAQRWFFKDELQAFIRNRIYSA